ncbi:MAG: NusG domain II-containing protein [Ruminococcus sp.]|jgi:hypothetical protein|nr:NusG domain II-containing protein [Ruminococcus sp.]
MKKIIKPKEAVIIIVLVILLIVVFFISKGSANTAEITVITDDLKETYSVDLSEDRIFDIKNMQFEVKSGDICVISSGCPGGDCVHMGRASENGGVIVCVPNRVTVRLTDIKNEYDAII